MTWKWFWSEIWRLWRWNFDPREIQRVKQMAPNPQKLLPNHFHVIPSNFGKIFGKFLSKTVENDRKLIWQRHLWAGRVFDPRKIPLVKKSSPNPFKLLPKTFSRHSEQFRERIFFSAKFCPKNDENHEKMILQQVLWASAMSFETSQDCMGLTIGF